MDRDSARQEIKRHWKTFYPADKKGGIICPLCGSGSGKKGTGITEDPKKPGQLKCWACGFQGDVIDLIEQDTGADYNTALSSAAADLGITIDHRETAAEDFKRLEKAWKDHHPMTEAAEAAQTALNESDDIKAGQQDETPQTGAQGATGAAITDYTAYYRECAARLNSPEAVSYLQARGISPETAAAYNVGFDPAWISPQTIKNQKAKGSNWLPAATARIILPVSKNHYVARAIEAWVDKDYSKMNETGGGKIEIFNLRALYSEQEAVFVTEGIFDALSIIEAGAAAIALNSTSNADKLLKQLEQEATKATVILCLDNDESGKKADAVIREGLTRLNISYVTADICGGYNDPNDALRVDRAAFETAIRIAEIQAAEAAEKAKALPGLLTYSAAVNIFETADNETIELKSFPTFSKTAKIKKHDSIVIAADTGGGKSSLAINFMNDLSEKYPCIYINLEMDTIDVLQRLVAIQSGLEIDRIQGYQNDPQTAEAVNVALQSITNREPLQIIQGAYLMEEVQEIIEKSTKDREKPTAVFIDHSLLMDTRQGASGRYDRFTQVSEGLRKMALKYNIILFVLLQQNRAGKAVEDERPKNSSLKESGSWENDSTQICFLWYDPNDRKKKLLLTKNRHGNVGEFVLNYWKKTQTYTEATGRDWAKSASPIEFQSKPGRREKQREKLESAYTIAYTVTGGHPTLRAIAEAADVTTATVKGWIKEYGGCTVDGVKQEPAGIDTEVEYTGFIKLTAADDNPHEGGEQPQENKPKVSRSF